MALVQDTPVQVVVTGSIDSQVKTADSYSLIIYDDVGAGEYIGVVVDISSGSIVLGPTKQLLGAGIRGRGDVDKLESGKFIFVYSDFGDSQQYKLRVLTVSGTTIGNSATPVDVATWSGTGDRAYVAATTSSKGMAIFNVGAGERHIRFTVGGVGGDEVTITDDETPTNTGTTLGLRRLDDNRVLRFYYDEFGNASWSIIDITSGITEGTEATTTDRDPRPSGSRHPMVYAGSNKFVTVYSETSSSPDESIGIIAEAGSGTTMQGLGTPLTLTANFNAQGGTCCMTDDVTVLAYHEGVSSVGKIETFDISGTSLVSNSDQINASYGDPTTLLELVEPGKALIAFSQHVAIITGIPLPASDAGEFWAGSVLTPWTKRADVPYHLSNPDGMDAEGKIGDDEVITVAKMPSQASEVVTKITGANLDQVADFTDNHAQSQVYGVNIINKDTS